MAFNRMVWTANSLARTSPLKTWRADYIARKYMQVQPVGPYFVGGSLLWGSGGLRNRPNNWLQGQKSALRWD
jgi:hypothetical protein